MAVDSERWKQLPECFWLVVDVVSPIRDAWGPGFGVKARGLASGRVPLYLVIDVLAARVTLFGEPSGGRYRSRVSVPFGGAVPFPPPFDAVLDTSVFFR